ncbi:hypothetical protein G7Y89_g15360 [Cudoniella acicularis]|uniref:Wax synthase domain-containing protein n=1 Tax=Cudoniella acicularis TaxID=354080 RepID=A0A8H4QP86_9HELO|nr:hypothetical protein G7Y89_g15360 [Cudoniella acicularis]
MAQTHTPPPNAFALPANRELATPTGSIIPHILLWLIQIITLSAPHFRGRRALFSCAIIFLAISALQNSHFTNDAKNAQPFALAWANWLATLEKILFSGDAGPEGSFWRVGHDVREAEAFSAFSFSKLKWALVLIFNLRGVRWNYEVKNVPKAPKALRKSHFIRTQLLSFEYYFLMADIMSNLWIRLYYTSPAGTVGQLDSKYLTILHPDWRWRLTKTLIFGPLPYYFMNVQYTLLSIPAVLLGMSQPQACL